MVEFARTTGPWEIAVGDALGTDAPHLPPPDLFRRSMARTILITCFAKRYVDGAARSVVEGRTGGSFGLAES